MKLLLDMNLPPRWCSVLEEAGIEARHWREVGDPRATGTEIMAYAAAEECVLVTHDLDFGAIPAATKGSKPSVVQLRGDDISPDAGAQTLLSALRECETDLNAGALLSVDLARFRTTLLPLRS